MSEQSKGAAGTASANAAPGASPGFPWHLRLYVSEGLVAARAAEMNLRGVCETHLAGQYFLEVFDLRQHPAEAEEDRIFAIPTALRLSPGPIKKIIGDLSDTPKLIEHLGIPMAGGPQDTAPGIG